RAPGGVEASEEQPRRRGSRWPIDPRCRAARSRAVPGRAGLLSASGRVPSAGGTAAVHTEGGWEAAAVGDSDGTGPGGSDGGEVGAGAGVRGGFSAVLVWLPAQAQRDDGP